MSTEHLAQDDVDRLMDMMSGGASDVAAADTDNEPTVALDLAKMERVIRGRMPVLELINEREAQSLRAPMYAFTRRQFEVQAQNVEVMKYGVFMSKIRLPSAICVVQLSPPLRGNALFIVDAGLVFLIEDVLFGGSGKMRTRAEGRDFTRVEQKIVQELMRIVLEAYTKAWEPVAPLTFQMIRMEMNPQFVAIASPTEAVLSYGFEMSHGELGGAVSICIPYSAVEPLQAELRSTLRSEDGMADYWRPEIRNKLLAARVGVRTEVARLELTLGDLRNLQPGDILPIETPSEISVEVEGTAAYIGRPGAVDGNNAVQITRNLFDNEDALLRALGLDALRKPKQSPFSPLIGG